MGNVLLAPTRSDKVKAWSVHLFTASGVIWGLLGMIAVMNGEWQSAFFWMIIATFVDGVDGTLARKAKVKGVLPEFDGALLDNILDYLTYVILPALFFYNHPDLLPVGWQLFGAVLISLVSAYQFCQADAKTDDHTFKGFPSYWNIVVLYLFILNLSPWLNLSLIVLLSILVFVPIRYAYPSRMTKWKNTTLILSSLWSLEMMIIVFQLPDPNQFLIYSSLIFVVYYIGISLVITFGNFLAEDVF